MKTLDLIKTYTLLLWVTVFVTGCEDIPGPIVYEEPLATFSVDDNNLSSEVDQVFEITAYPQPEGKVYSKWYVDDILESSNESFSYIFKTPGLKKVCYVAKNGAGEFTKCFNVAVGDILSISLSIGDSTRIERLQYEELMIAAIVEAGVDIVHQWEVDGMEVSTDNVLSGILLNEIKTYHVKYTGTNSAGTYTHEFDVDVLDRPLQVDFSNKDAKVRLALNDVFHIKATILYGGVGATHEWKIDGTTVSTSDELAYLCNAAGVYAITYKCVNGIGEEVTRSWELEVVDASWLIDDFETGNFSATRFQSADPTLSVITNPKKTGINASDYCLQQHIPANAATSGIIWLNFKRDGLNDQVSGIYGGIKFKYYKYTNDRKVEVEMNDSSTKATPVVEGGLTKDGSSAPVETWVECEFRFPPGFTTDINRLTLRVLRGSGGIPVTALIDDVQLIP